MPLGGSQAIAQQYVYRQTTEPRRVDGVLWINPAGGASGNNDERYTFNDSAGTWELNSSVGPDTPSYPVSGALWRDTGASKQKVYDGSAWVGLGVTDHAKLSNVTAGQHQAVPAAESDDLSDITAHRQGQSHNNSTLLSVTNGPGLFLGGWVTYDGTGGGTIATLTVDGTSTGIGNVDVDDEQDYTFEAAYIPPVSYDSSLDIVLHGDASNQVSGYGWTK